MALVKCPDCEKMISARVDSCPFCGCPRKFFLQCEETETVKPQNSNDKILASENLKDDKEVPVEIVSFTLGPKTISYDKRSASFAAMFGDYRKIADNALCVAIQKYDEASSFESALSAVMKYAETVINDTVSKGVKFLYDHQIIMTSSEFINRYDIDFSSYTQNAKQAKARVLAEKQKLELNREMEKASRARWQGGGFGLKGAIKGAVTAGALNMGSDFLHSFGDASKARQDDQIIRGKTDNIRQEYQKEICNGVYYCVLDIYNGMVKELNKANFFEKPIDLDAKKAQTLFEATMKNATTEDEVLDHLLSCIVIFPGNKRITDTLIPLLSKYPGTDFSNWLEFWHLDYRYPNYKEDKSKADEFDNFMYENGVKSINFKNPNVESYAQLRKWINEYYEKYNVETIPEASYLANAIKEYYQHMDGLMIWYAVIEWVPLECNIYEFMSYMKKEREGLIHSFLPLLWLYGDRDEKIPPKVKEHILIFYDSSLMSSGRKGFIVTTKAVYDLKSWTRILLSEIEDIRINNDRSIEIVERGDSIRIKEARLFNINALKHFAKMLRVICVRYAGNEKLWEDEMRTPKPKSKSESLVLTCPFCGKNVRQGTKFCNYCGNSLIDLKEEPAIVEKMICKSCGKEILASTRFCNFCGQPVER